MSEHPPHWVAYYAEQDRQRLVEQKRREKEARERQKEAHGAQHGKIGAFTGEW